MFRSLRRWLGPARLQYLIGSLILTGIASTVLQVAFAGEDWVISAQTALVIAFLMIAFSLVAGRLSPQMRGRMAFTLLPALGALALGAIIPGLFRLFAGAAVGWLIASQVLLRNTEKREYKLAVKAMRQRDYDTAIQNMTALIKKEPDVFQHYQFRAQLYRFNNNHRKAQRDYEQIIKLAPDTGIGENGLAELNLRLNNLREARQWSEAAHEKAPDEWVALHNLGLIAERQKDDEAAQNYLQEALDLGLPDVRYRLLTRLILIRSFYRTGNTEQAEALLSELKKDKPGLREWQIMLESEEGSQQLKLLERDIEQAADLLQGESLDDVFAAA